MSQAIFCARHQMLDTTWAGAAREVYASILASTSLKASQPSALAPPAGTMM